MLETHGHSMYHRFLRIGAVVVAVTLVFESGLVSQSTRQLSQQTHSYLANAVGMSASVRPTELNTYTAALSAKERELEEREAALREREISVEISNGGTSATGNMSTYVLASILFILLVLIILNYALDYLRSREQQQTQPV